VKEAVKKAFGRLDMDVMDFKLLEIVYAENGPPMLHLHSESLIALGIQASLSMPHCKEYVTATVVLSKE
jgi:phosphopantetheinyl transferase (holo-ACP synthase)